MENTKIEWCATLGPDGIWYPGHTFNSWWGCLAVSPACTNCYAENFANRFHPGLWGPAKTTPRKIASEEYWKQPLKWNKKAKELGVQIKVFSNSMSDLFEDHPGVIDARKRQFDLIEATPNLDWLLLTKRPENILAMVPDWWLNCGFPNNVWMGTTVENQNYADERIPLLLKIPAKVRFLSMEPLCGPVEFSNVTKRSDAVLKLGKKALNGIQWVIAGGESGQQAAPSHPSWFRSLRDQCTAANVPYFFKQWGEWAPVTPLPNKSFNWVYNDGHVSKTQAVRDFERGVFVSKLGKHASGRLLDGVLHDGMPA